MAFLMRSAAEPCTGVFMAWRSASARTWKFLAWRSGSRRSRPRSVRTVPVSPGPRDGLVDEARAPSGSGAK